MNSKTNNKKTASEFEDLVARCTNACIRGDFRHARELLATARAKKYGPEDERTAGYAIQRMTEIILAIAIQKGEIESLLQEETELPESAKSPTLTI